MSSCPADVKLIRTPKPTEPATADKPAEKVDEPSKKAADAKPAEKTAETGREKAAEKVASEKVSTASRWPAAGLPPPDPPRPEASGAGG
jgi:hypothetical protein